MLSAEIIKVSTREELVNKVTAEFKLQYGNEPDSVALTPGRINIVGEHTDYNDGLAMPAAIDRFVCTAISKCNQDFFVVFSMNYRQSSELSPDITTKMHEPWISLVSTVINVLKSEHGIQGGGNIVVGGNIPIGCGLSSSAAFVISITVALCRLFTIQIKDRKLAALCQKIENAALGITRGLLDQYGIIFSKKDHSMMIDFKDNSIKYLPLLLNGCSWVVVNSRINRELSESAYFQRVKECRDGLEILKSKFSIDGFRDIAQNMLSTLEKEHKVSYKRLLHLLDENNRVKEMKIQLEKGDNKKIGKILQESHKSLKIRYEVSCEEIDYIIKYSESFVGWYGGRIIGGGFGGCSLHLIADNAVEKYGNYISNSFEKKYGIKPDIIKVQFPGGVSCTD